MGTLIFFFISKKIFTFFKMYILISNELSKFQNKLLYGNNGIKNIIL